MRRRSTRGQAAPPDEDAAERDAAQQKTEVEREVETVSVVSVCAVCSEGNRKKTVECPGCCIAIHLSCVVPPRKRAPPSGDTQWRCGHCKAEEEEEEEEDGGAESEVEAVAARTTRSKRRAGAKNKDEAGKDTTQTKAVNGRATRRSQRNVNAGTNAMASETVADQDDTEKDGGGDGEDGNDDDDCKEVAKQREDASADRQRPRRGAARSVGAAGSKPQVSTKVDSSPPAKSRTLGKRKAAQPPSKAKTIPKRKRKNFGAGSSDDESDGGDDDADSDFEVVESSEQSADDGNATNGDDSDFEDASKVKKLPKPAVSRRAAPAKRTNATTKAKVGRVPQSAGRRTKPAKGSDDDSLGIDSDGPAAENGAGNEANADTPSRQPRDEEEEDDEEEPYTGPQYFIEYAPNARSRCRACDEKLPKDGLRVGIRIRHSMFGITTYYKHVQCTQICLPKEEKDEDTKPKENETSSNEKATNQSVPEVIRGFNQLQAKDKEFVLAEMRKNTDAGKSDERIELAEDQYNRKTRMPQKDPSKHLTVPLLPYQREALAWMTAQEKSDYKGGILADEMGMGKTIQAISVILENKRLDPSFEHVASGSVAGADVTRFMKKRGAQTKRLIGGTLVICPLVAVTQWRSEIERFVDQNYLSIYIHHGPKRADLASKIASYDVVLTTYSIVESEVRKKLGWEKVPCKYCKRKFLPEKLVFHNRYFCGPNAKKTSQQDKQQTKKKGGKKAAGEESDSDDDRFNPKKLQAKGKRKAPPKKSKKKEEEEDSDDEPLIVKERGKSPLHDIYWTRIVLDEAHYIKDRKCNTARGVFELQSEYKWCLSGTPLQNRIGELFSLIRFLQIKSFAYYHCSKCTCQILDYDFPDGKCAICQHPAMHHFSFFNKKIVIPIQSYGYVGEGKIAMLRLQNEVLQHILLRRTKEGRADDICLPPKLVRVRKDHLDERENDFYEAIYTQSQAQFNTYVSSGTLLNNYAHIFDLLIRLRQAVDHPYLVIYSKSNPAIQLPRGGSSGSMAIRPLIEEKPLIGSDEVGLMEEDVKYCGFCHSDIEDLVAAKCSHEFCRSCVEEFVSSLPVGVDAKCPECDKPLTVDLTPPALENTFEQDEAAEPVAKRAKTLELMAKYHKGSIMHRISDIHAFQTSTKIEALMQELDEMKRRDPSGKAIVFSQFVNMLDIIQHRLTLGGIKSVKLSGSMSMDARDRMLRSFREDSAVTVFLISLKAGGVALNLTVASHIFLMDPWWNPAAENQAIDRTHRLGQFKPIQATRFIIAGTVEERILKLQEKKRLIFEGTVGASVSALCRLTEEDLRFLFSR
ncbi:TPA: hypothetical protein N0F65_012878 [Lagenidium giganteum]|uniref:DNA repair protein RAD16 n=1 Tax=Lagenidium giganteum TaxID=4803 RepID=A0AAV2YGY8_9STRA|nr:TPA: hypothetical protein N0F65_012878 [Lagenidium giganteum]